MPLVVSAERNCRACRRRRPHEHGVMFAGRRAGCACDCRAPGSRACGDVARAARLTYPEVGRTAGDLPQGYRSINRTRRLPAGTDFDRTIHDPAALAGAAARGPSGCRVQRPGHTRRRRRAEHRYRTAGGPGCLPRRLPRRRAGARRFRLRPCPAIPSCGEEAFLLERHDDGSVSFTILAFSRPASALAKLAGPLGRRIQNTVTDRYLRALDTDKRHQQIPGC